MKEVAVGLRGPDVLHAYRNAPAAPYAPTPVVNWSAGRTKTGRNLGFCGRRSFDRLLVLLTLLAACRTTEAVPEFDTAQGEAEDRALDLPH